MYTYNSRQLKKINMKGRKFVGLVPLYNVKVSMQTNGQRVKQIRFFTYCLHWVVESDARCDDADVVRATYKKADDISCIEIVVEELI